MTDNSHIEHFKNKLIESRHKITTLENRVHLFSLFSLILSICYLLSSLLGLALFFWIFTALLLGSGVVFYFSKKTSTSKRNDFNIPIATAFEIIYEMENPRNFLEKGRNLATLTTVSAEKNLKSAVSFKKILLLEKLAFPILLGLLFIIVKPNLAQQVLLKIGGGFASFASSTSVDVEKGLIDEASPKSYTLGGKSPVIELAPANLLVFHVKIPQTFPVPYLRFNVESQIKIEDQKNQNQSFQFYRVSARKNDNSLGALVEYELGLSFPHSGKVSLSHFGEQSVLRISILEEPVPEVLLSLADIAQTDRTSPLPDHESLQLRIQVAANAPINEVNLKIKSGKIENKELVRRVVGTDKKELDVDYSLLLEPYVEDDIQTFEIIAQATDFSEPRPLTGFSAPLVIEVASAYGRYRNTLRKLRELSENIGATLSEDEKLDEKMSQKINDAFKSSADVPFFDQGDRFELERLSSGILAAVEEKNSKNFQENLYTLKSELDSFLFEHEGIDDRERDRDFFVALRTYSRMLKSKKLVSQENSDSRQRISSEILKYLKDRQKRWNIRVNRIDKAEHPKSWPRISEDRPFQKSISNIGQLAEKEPTKALASASVLGDSYKSWIDELEAAEDKARASKEQERKETIASSRKQIKELQKTQAKISRALDGAASKTNTEEIAEQWPGLRLDQNQNVSLAGSVEGMLRSVSPLAAARMAAAKEQMEQGITKGNQENFGEAETSSDLAGRLLVQADQAAQRSASKQGQGHKRRRVAGDQYYGQSVTGQDIEIIHEYEVDQKYRQKVLEDIDENLDLEQKDEKAALENYLRSVVR